MKKTYTIINNKYIVDKEANFTAKEWYYDIKQEKIRNGSNNYAIGGYKQKIIATIGEENRINGLPVVEFEDNNIEKLALEYFEEQNKNLADDTGWNKIPALRASYIKTMTPIFIAGYKAAQSKGCWTNEDILSFINNEDNHTEGELGNSCIDVATLRNHFSSKKQPQLTEIELDVQSQYYEDIPHNTDNPDFIWNLIITHPNDKGGIIKI